MLIKWGSIVVEGSGKLGGHVYYKGKGDSVIRTLARARNPQTRSQQTIKSRFTKLTQDWSNLTDDQRQSWNEATSSFSRKNRFGDTVLLTGKNLYNALNQQLLLVNEPILMFAPRPGVTVRNTVNNAVMRNARGNLLISGDFKGGTTYVILGTAELSAGVQEIGNRFRIFSVAESSGTGAVINGFEIQYNRYVAKFGVLPNGANAYIGTYSVNKSGQKSSISIVKITF